MSFDRLPGRISHIPELYPRLILPPKPVVPWASLIVPAVDRIASAIQYQSPYERQKRGLEMAQVNAQMSMMPQQLDLQRREMAVKEKQLGFQEKFYNQTGNGSNLPPGWVMSANGPVYDPTKYKTALSIRQMQNEANDTSNYGNMAEAYRQQSGHQPTNPVEHDDDPALVDWYKAVAKGKKPHEIQYDAEGNIIDDEQNDE